MVELSAFFAAAFGGVPVVLTGLFAWLGQRKLKELEQRQKQLNDMVLMVSKARLDTESALVQHAGKYQFDLEASHYKRIWEAIQNLDEAEHALLFHRSNETGQKSYSTKRREYQEARTALLLEWKRGMPFYAKSVFEQIGKLMEHVSNAERKDAEGRSEVGERKGLIHAETLRHSIYAMDSRNAIAEAIRVRLSGQFAAQ